MKLALGDGRPLGLGILLHEKERVRRLRECHNALGGVTLDTAGGGARRAARRRRRCGGLGGVILDTALAALRRTELREAERPTARPLPCRLFPVYTLISRRRCSLGLVRKLGRG